MQTTFAPQALQHELQNIANGIKARRAAEQAKAAAHCKPMAAQATEERRAELQAQLDQARIGFDPAYAYSDDHTQWREQLAKAHLIGQLQSELDKLPKVAS